MVLLSNVNVAEFNNKKYIYSSSIWEKGRFFLADEWLGLLHVRGDLVFVNCPFDHHVLLPAVV